MLFRTINTKSVGSNLKLPCCVAKGHERKDPDKNPDSISLQILECADIHSLRAINKSVSVKCTRIGIPVIKDGLDSLISQPIAKVDTLDHCRGPFVAMNESKCLNGILDISMPPILALDGRYRSDIYIVSNYSVRTEMQKLGTYSQHRMLQLYRAER